MIPEGSKAPNIRAPSTTGPFRLDEYLDAGPVVLFFYPKADTPGCTIEVQEFDGWLDQIEDLGAHVAGCSVDSLEDQKAFAERYSLRFPLIADADAEIATGYDVLREPAKAGRRTLVIGQDGTVLKTYPDEVQAVGHAEQVLTDLRALLQ